MSPQYNTGLLVGRAFSYANRSDAIDVAAVADELLDLAGADRLSIVLARARFEEFVAGPSATPADRRALSLLDAALSRFDSLVAA